MLTMDKLDQQIIQEIIKNGRKPFSTIAKKLGVSTQTIMRRYNEMKTNGTIALSTITIDLEKVGYLGTAHMLIKTKPNGNSSQIVEQLSKTPNIITAARTIGSYDAYAVLAFRDINDLYENIIKIRKLPDLLTVNVSFGIPGTKRFPPKIERNELTENEESTNPK
jgi:Lrp/AsnC family transcriptional regulator for asnA, asnC and gidA